jgi:phosphorylcholine metabolism protein LicD
MITKSLLIALLLVCSPIICNPEILKRTDEKVILQLYQIMKDVDAVFRLAKIPYWADFGTLLGSVRHKGIIPWDDDLDISIDVRYKKRLRALKPIFSKLGYTLRKAEFSHFYKVFPKKGIKHPTEKAKFPFIDIFVRKHVDGKFFYLDNHQKITAIWGKRVNKPLYITEKELFPLQEYEFGSFTILGPHNPLPYLNAAFGNDWNRIAYRQYDHAVGKPIKKIKVKLTDEDRKPAQPLGPLQDHDYLALFAHHTSQMARFVK